jgi:hypothetical protein
VPGQAVRKSGKVENRKQEREGSYEKPDTGYLILDAEWKGREKPEVGYLRADIRERQLHCFTPGQGRRIK